MWFLTLQGIKAPLVFGQLRLTVSGDTFYEHDDDGDITRGTLALWSLQLPAARGGLQQVGYGCTIKAASVREQRA